LRLGEAQVDRVPHTVQCPQAHQVFERTSELLAGEAEARRCWCDRLLLGDEGFHDVQMILLSSRGRRGPGRAADAYLCADLVLLGQ
jgi:hypothetical protein